jgi:hypothetical protein
MGNLYFITFVYSVLALNTAFAQTCIGENNCRSELLRVEVESSLIENVLNENALPLLESMAQSEFLNNTIVQDYDVPAFSFPHNKQACLSEQQNGNRDFQNIDCEATNLCQNGVVSQNVRQLLCFALPCTLIEGQYNEGDCQGVTSLYSESVGFPQPIRVNNLKINPTSADIQNGVANICFDIEELDVGASASLNLDTSQTELNDHEIQVRDISVVLDAPKSVCVSANVDFASENPITNININSDESSPFISNEMILSAARSANVSGLSGYSQEDLDSVKNDLLPVLFHPLREQVETGIKNSLQVVFETQITSLANSLSTPGTNRALFMDSSESLGMLNVSNTRVLSQLAVLECATLQANNRPIPANHECIGSTDVSGEPITVNSQLDASSERISMSSLLRNTNANDEEIIDRLQALSPLILSEPFDADRNFVVRNNPEGFERMHNNSLRRFVDTDIAEAIESIRQNRLRESAINIIGITDRVTDNESRELSLITPELCDTTQPSNHFGRRIPNCSAQTYVDLEEFNNVLAQMWQTGALCQAGRGSEREMSRAQAPIGYTVGCYINIASGFSCYLKSPPRLSYNSRTRRYDTALELERCYKMAAGGMLGELARLAFPELESLGSFGADFNINLSSRLNVNNEGDIIAENSRSTFNIVPGSESGGLLEDDMWNDEVVEGVNEAFSEALSQVLTIPVQEMTSSMVGFPIRATGRIDSGAGYIGVCFEPTGSAE